MSQPTIAEKPAGQTAVRGSRRWRTVDIVVAAVIAVAFGLIFFGWDQIWGVIDKAIVWFPPVKGLLTGVWFLPAVLGPAIIRKPGAGLFTELVAASIEQLLGAQWGMITIVAGLMQGVGGEIPYLATRYRSNRLPVALVGGLLAGTAGGLQDIIFWYPTYSATWKIAQVGAEAVSGMIIAGLLGWLLTRALARTGALDRFPAGRERGLD